MHWLLGKRGDFSVILSGILVVVVIVFVLFAFKGPIIDGFNSFFKLGIKDDGELKIEDSALDVLAGAYEHCKGEAGSGCLCSGGVNLALNKDEIVTVSSEGSLEGGVLVESNQEGSRSVETVNFCVAQHERAKTSCSFVYDNDGILWKNEKISFSFLNGAWTYPTKLPNSVDSISDSQLDTFYQTAVTQDGWYSADGTVLLEDRTTNDALSFAISTEGGELVITSFEKTQEMSERLSFPFSGKLISFNYVREFKQGDICDRDLGSGIVTSCVSVGGKTFLLHTYPVVAAFTFTYYYDSRYMPFKSLYDIYTINGDLYLAPTYDSRLGEIDSFRTALGKRDLASSFSSLDECSETYTDETILAVCENLKGKDYLEGLGVMADHANRKGDTIIVGGYSGELTLSEGFDSSDLRDACYGFYTKGMVSILKDKGNYKSNSVSFDLTPFITPVTLYRVVEDGKLYLCLIPKTGFDSVPACKADVGNVPITDPLGALYNPYDKLGLEWGSPLVGVTINLGKFNHPNFEGYDPDYYPYRYRSIHRGIDLAGKAGEPVLAVAEGIVAAVRSCTYVIHTDGQQTYTSAYCHVNGDTSLVDKAVKKGDIIGTLRNDAPPHIHLELYSAELDTEIPGAGESSILTKCGCINDKDCDAKNANGKEIIKGCGILDQDYFLIPPEDLIAGI